MIFVDFSGNRDFVDGDAPAISTAPLAQVTPSITSSLVTSTFDEEDEMSDQKQGSVAAFTPLSVDIFSGVSDFLSVSTDHLSPCHGFNDRLLDRRWYSTWRCDSVDSSFHGGVITNQPTASLPSRSSSSSKRRSTRSVAMRDKSRSRSDSLQIPAMSRRWSLPSPPQDRSRSSSSGKLSFEFGVGLKTEEGVRAVTQIVAYASGIRLKEWNSEFLWSVCLWPSHIQGSLVRQIEVPLDSISQTTQYFDLCR